MRWLHSQPQTLQCMAEKRLLNSPQDDIHHTIHTPLQGKLQHKAGEQGAAGAARSSRGGKEQQGRQGAAGAARSSGGGKEQRGRQGAAGAAGGGARRA